MKRQTIISSAAIKIDDCAKYIKNRFENDDYQAQILRFDDNGENGILVQIRNTKTGTLKWMKTLTGLETCATLKLLTAGENLKIEVLAGKWLDKATVAAVSWFVLWPLLFTAAIGSIKQKHLLDRVFIDSLGYFSDAQ